MVPVTRAGDAVAGVVTIGPTVTTETVAVTATVPLAARIVADPGVDGAVYRPAESTDPIPEATVQANAGCGTIGRPNWSVPTAANGCTPFVGTVAVPGADGDRRQRRHDHDRDRQDRRRVDAVVDRDGQVVGAGGGKRGRDGPGRGGPVAGEGRAGDAGRCAGR